MMQNDLQYDCELCGKPSVLKHDSFQGYQLGMTFKIYACLSCNTSFSIPRADTHKIYDAIYSNGEKVPGYNRYWSYMNEVKTKDDPLQYLASREEAFWAIERALQQVVKDKRNTKILELGSGLGYLTYALQKDGYNIQGLDISSEAVSQAQKNFGDYYVCSDVHDYALEKPEAYEVVILTEVIEHVEEPMRFIQSILKLLKKGGHIVVTTPNKSLIPEDIVWDSEAPPVHHWWFSEDSMKYIAKTLSLDIRFIDYTDYYFLHPEAYNLRRKRKRMQRTPVLNEQGELISTDTYTPSEVSDTERKKKAASKRRWLKIKSFFNPKTIVFAEKGIAMCVLFRKNE